jgi:TonB-linked SusC/RagA family outer membrane protein
MTIQVLRRIAVASALLGSLPATALAQQGTTISGRVTGDAQAPIQGASITVSTLGAGGYTDAQGRYSFTIPAARVTGQTVTLSARRIGFTAKAVQITLTAAPITQDFQLSAAPTQLTGVVITALSQQKEKATIGTSQQEVGGEELTRSKTTSIASALSGKVSGVQINQSGNMGGTSRIVIRGAGSIRGENQPLFIIDGIPVSNADFSTASASGGRDYGSAISDLNMDDVASVTVLKGPNAAALYGSRASNGAIVITTKTGRNAPRGTQFSFTSRVTADQPSIMPDYQDRYGQGFVGEFQYVDGAGGGVNDGADESWGPKLDGRLIDQFHGKQQPWIAHPDNVNNFFRTGSTVSNNLTVTTNAEGMGARLSVTRDDIRGIVPNTSLGKLAGMLSANATIKSKLDLSGNLQYTQTNGLNRPENGYTEGNPLMSFTWFGRQVDIQSLKNKYYNKNSPYGLPDGSLYNWNDNYHRNPYWQFYENPAPDSRDRVVGQIAGNYEIASWLTALARVGGDNYRNTTIEQFAKGNIDRASASYNGGFTNNTNRAREVNYEGILTARKNLSFLDMTLNLGGNQRRNDSYNNRFATSGILVEKIYNLANAGITPTVTNSEFHSAVNSAYGSLAVTLNRWWTVEATGRNDWSSTLPKENASYFYPSLSTAMVLTDLFPGIADQGIVSYLKLRGGWVRVGSDAGPYQLATVYGGDSRKFSGLPLYSLSNSSANAFLKPEQTTASEGGLEFSLFDDRITFDGTYYAKITRDQILPLTTAPATGFSSTIINAGQITNRGFEASVTARPIKMSNGFTWTTTFNYLKNKNKVDKLAPGLTATPLASQWSSELQAREGHPYGVIFGYAYARDSATGKIITSGGLPTRDPVKRVLGNVNPDWVGGWANEMRYKNLSLNVLVDFRRGGENFSVGNWWGTYAGVLKSTLRGRETDWNSPGLVVDGIDKTTKTANTVNVIAEDYYHTVYPINEAAVLSTAFTKLREVRLSWDAPSSFSNRVRLSHLNIAFVGRNLLTWTDFPNFDPENSANAGNGGQGYDMGAMPTTRSFGFNLTVTP